MADITGSITKIRTSDNSEHFINAKYWDGHEWGELASALKYCGITTTKLTDGATTNPVVIGGTNHTATAGCVVFYEDTEGGKPTTKEFVFNGSKWELLGADLTYKVVQSTVSSPNADGSAMAFIDTISQDANGVITVTKKYCKKQYRLEYTATKSLGNLTPCNINSVSHEYNTSTGKGAFIYDEAPTSIGDSAFSECASLTSVTIPNSVTKIGDYAFEYCSSLTSVTIPDSVTSIGRSAFSYCDSLTSVTIPNSVTSIGSYAFYHCYSLTSVTIPNSVTSIGDYAFYYCNSLTSVTIGNSVTSIGEYAFSECTSLTEIYIPDSVTSIGEYAFYNCGLLVSVTIGNGVTSIGEHAFSYCYFITSVTIGNSITSIGEGAFEGCNVTSFYIRGENVPYISDGLFYDGNVSKIYVPINSLDAYKSATNWSEYADRMVGVVFEDENLVSGENIKTINGESILGKGDINITTTNIVEITYDKLKSLRNNSKLVPGQQYRITDYITTTSQKYTYSAEHQFDIIVTALNENTLSEEAKAIQHEGDDYFANSNLSAWKIWYCLDNDTNRFSWAGKQRNEVGYESCNIDTSRCVLTIPSNDPEDDGKRELKNMVRAVGTIMGDPTTNGWYETNKKEIFSHYSYEEDNNGIMQLTLHSRDVDGDLDGDYTIGRFGSPYHYNGTIEIEGNEYSVWREYEGGGNYADNNGDSNGAIYLLTDKITKGNIKRFDEVIDETIYINPKGVIYRMIDEWNNDCPYDFKNIKFNRIVTHNGCLATGSEFEGYNNVFCYTFGFYDGDTYVDASVFGNTTGDSEGVYNNIIKTFNSLEYGENDDSILDSGSDDYISQQYYIQQSLNDIVFMMNILNYEYYTCRNNIFGEGCHSNTFGNYCHDNTFGEGCGSNIFGDYCDSNTFGNYCHDNTFGEGCGSNIFGNYCQFNTFGDTCIYNTFGCNFNSNTFGDTCEDNTFGNNCNSNIFGNNCESNTFGESCDSNTFGNDCYNNTFENYYSNNIISDGYRNNHVLKSDIISTGDITAVDINATGSITAESISSKGTINSDGNIASKGNITATGTMTSAGFYQSSDERLKIFKSDINVDLDKLAELRKSYFTFIEDPGTNRLGVSAQEIQELYPEIVTEGADGFLKVDYSNLSVIALKAIDILYNKNKELEDRLNKIEKMLNL